MPFFSVFAFFPDFLSNVNFQSVTKMAKNVTKCQFCPLQKIKGSCIFNFNKYPKKKMKNLRYKTVYVFKTSVKFGGSKKF